MQADRIAHYRLVRKLGIGGMGEVWLAEDDRLKREVALKFLPAELASDADRRRRFLAEARSASQLNHPNVCVIHEIGEADDRRPFITMEFVSGGTLAERIERGPLPLAEITSIGIQSADALDAAHAKGIIHRDIKPGNIGFNERGYVKVLDFGLAKRVAVEGGSEPDSSSGSPHTQTGAVLGTPLYMSPEQALGRQLDHRSDLFSLGVVLYELVTGRPPFSGSSFGEVVDRIVHAQPDAMLRFNYEVTPELERIIRKCLAKDPSRRYQSARDLLVDLKNLSRDLGSDHDDAAKRGALVDDASTVDLSLREALGDAVAADASPDALRESDVFISYARVDDQPLSAGSQGWISRFHRNLEVRVEQISGERIKIWRRPGATESVDEKIIEHLPHLKAMVSVLSPPYIKSAACRREVEEFWHSAVGSGARGLGDRSRIFKVVKRPVATTDVPPPLDDLFSTLLDFDFYEVDPETGRLREYDESFGPDALQRYHERVYDLAHEISRVLEDLKRNGGEERSAPSNGRPAKTVYLATTTSDLDVDRDRIRRELVARGHIVLPERPLPVVRSELEAVVRACLEKCSFAIHPVGSTYGVVPEGAERSLLELQNQLAAERAARPDFTRVIWIPETVRVRDPRQQRWIGLIKESPEEHRGAEIVESSLESLKGIVLDLLSPSRKSEVRLAASRQGPPRVYLICDRQDEQAIEILEDFLFDRGLEVSLPDFDADEAEAAENHRRNLCDCDAAIIYYGSARSAWVDVKLRSLAKAAGYGRSEDLAVRAVWVAPPFDRRKERFRTHLADVLRQEGAFNPTLLEPFVERLEAKRDEAHG